MYIHKSTSGPYPLSEYSTSPNDGQARGTFCEGHA